MSVCPRCQQNQKAENQPYCPKCASVIAIQRTRAESKWFREEGAAIYDAEMRRIKAERGCEIPECPCGGLNKEPDHLVWLPRDKAQSVRDPLSRPRASLSWARGLDLMRRYQVGCKPKGSRLSREALEATAEAQAARIAELEKLLEQKTGGEG